MEDNFVVVLAKPAYLPLSTGWVKRAFIQPYDSTDEKERLIKCFKSDPAVKEILDSSMEFFNKYGKIKR